MIKKKIVFVQKQRAELLSEEFDAALAGNQILVANDYSLISAGTELANYNALPNTQGAQKFPVHPGYSACGHVLSVGSEVKNLRPGDRVIVRWAGHDSHFVLPETELFPVIEGVSSQEAAFAHVASFSLLGVRKLQIQLGESAMIAGCGLLGLLAVQFARLAGANPVIACDFSPERRQKALELGADLALDPRESDFVEKVKAATGGKGVDCVVEVTGFISALQQALEYIAWEGRITLLGCTRISDQCIDFYKYVHRRGITLIGCHTFTRPKVDSRPGEWSEFDDYATFMRYIAAKRMLVSPIVSTIANPADAPALYAKLSTDKDPPCGILLDWSRIK